MSNFFLELLNLIGYLIRRYVFYKKIKLDPIGTNDLMNIITGIIFIIVIFVIASWILGYL